MPYCINAVSIAYALLATMSILVLALVALRPQAIRQVKANEKFKQRKIIEYGKENYARLNQDYRDFVAKGYPNTKEQDRVLYTEDYYIKSKATVAIENSFLGGTLSYPSVWLTDTRLIVVGTIFSVAVVLFQSLYPMC